MARTHSVTQLPEALQAAKRAKVGVRNIQRNGVWILSNDSSDAWKITAIIGAFGLFGSFVWWIPGTGDHMPPTWFLAIWTVCGLAFSGACFFGSWWLAGNNSIAARIDPAKGIVIFSPRKGERPVRLPIAQCYVQLAQEVTTESPVARVGMPLGKNYPEFVDILIGSALTPSTDQNQVHVGVRLPYAEVGWALKPLLALGPWAGISMTDAHSALREKVMTQVRQRAGHTPIYIPKRAADCMPLVSPYRVYEA